MSISIIIPTLNEEGCLGRTLQLLREQRPHEILVVDGGSNDRTCAIAQAADRLLIGVRCRARQMNLGAAQASGEILLFLHADCVLEPGALAEVQRCLQRRGVVGGCFRMRVDSPGLLYRCIDHFAHARVRLAGFIYGDQGLFVRRELFHQLGGFPEVGLMEDVYFSKLLRRRGRLVVTPRRIFVSPRRWQKSGIIRQTMRNWMLLTLAVLGVPPDRLAWYYPAIR